MKKYLLLGVCLLWSFNCVAQQNEVEDFFSELVEEKQKPEGVEDKGLTARKVFEINPKTDNLPSIKAPKIETKAEREVFKKANIEKEVAPFGLYWGASMRDTEEAGVDLRPFTKKSEVNAYTATSLPKPIKDFSVVVDFGDTDELWKITAYSTPKEDNEKAERILEVYDRFYALLEKKYGMARNEYVDMPEDFTEEDETPTYMQALLKGSVKKAATFKNNNVTARIEIKALPDNMTYMTLEYISAKITKAREEDILDAL